MKQYEINGLKVYDYTAKPAPRPPKCGLTVPEIRKKIADMGLNPDDFVPAPTPVGGCIILPPEKKPSLWARFKTWLNTPDGAGPM